MTGLEIAITIIGLTFYIVGGIWVYCAGKQRSKEWDRFYEQKKLNEHRRAVDKEMELRVMIRGAHKYA